MRFGSVCSGIEAASVAWGPLGWHAAWLAEIEPFPSAVLAHHYPEVPNLGDMTALPERIAGGEIEAPDVFCGGTPCQAFSVAGLRKSLGDARGNLSLVFCEIADAIDAARAGRGEPATIIFWENVPGVLSTADNAFGCFLAGLAGESDPLVAPGGKWSNAGYVLGPQRAVAWRVLDAQYFGVAQRRRRVFVVASARDDFDPATVLFEWDGVRRDTAPSREARQVAPTIPARSTAGGGLGTDFDCDGGLIAGKQWPAEVCSTLDTTFGAKQGLEDQHVNAGCPMFVPVAFDTSEDGTGRGTPLGPVHCREIAQTITSNYGKQVDNSDTALGPNVVAFDTTQITSAANYSNPMPGDPCHPLAAGAHAPAIAFNWNAQPDQMRFDAHCSATLTRSQESAVAVALRGREGGATAELGDEVQNCLRASSGGGDKPHVLTAMQVRRLTPRECERLQGFPDGYTDIPWTEYQRIQKRAAKAGTSFEAELRKHGKVLRGPNMPACPDGPRYKALGNSWAVPNVRWIGARIAAHLNPNYDLFI